MEEGTASHWYNTYITMQITICVVNNIGSKIGNILNIRHMPKVGYEESINLNDIFLERIENVQ